MKAALRFFEMYESVIHRIGLILMVALSVTLPFQTRWLAVPAFLHGGYWEYGTLSVYITEIGIWVAFALWCAQWVAHQLSQEKRIDWKEKITHVIHTQWVYWAILVWVLVQLAWAPRTIASGVWLVHAISALLFYFLLVKFHMPLKIVVLALAIGFSCSGVLGIAQFGSQRIASNTVLGISAQQPEESGVSVVETPLRRWMRAYGTYPHPNIFGGMMVVGLSLWLLFFILAHDLVEPIDYWGRLIGVLGVVVTSAGLWLSFSRSAWLGFLISMIVAWGVMVVKKRYWFIPLLKWTVLSIVMLVALSYLFDDPFRARTSFLTTEPVYGYRLEDQSKVIRMAQWKEAYIIGIQRTFGAGTGVGNYTAWLGIVYPSLKVYQLQPFHITPLLALIELGVIGFAGVVVMITQWIRKNIKDAWALPVIAGFTTMMLFDHYWWTLFPGMIGVAIVAWLALQKPSHHVQLRIFGR
ncbi:MAG TPA: O-antigen ligase family protein [Patescibacteria group bacterium]|nr:O-antigen ligase family protein [Patescibacteria group bacterium]